MNPTLKNFLLAGTVIAGATALGTGAKAAVCPDVTSVGGTATTCNLTITFQANGSITTSFGPQTNYDGVEDSLIGVVNNTNHRISSFGISGTGIFGFDGDGIDTFITRLATPITAPAGTNPDTTGYGGPDGFFTNIVGNTGTVNFANGAIAPGASDFFSLEEPISKTAPPIIVPTPEPASIAIFGAALAGFGLLRRRKQKA
jgi:hypothetical protein